MGLGFSGFEIHGDGLGFCDGSGVQDAGNLCWYKKGFWDLEDGLMFDSRWRLIAGNGWQDGFSELGIEMRLRELGL